MSFSRVVKIGDGTTNQFTVNFALGYLQEQDVTARVGSEVDGSGNPVYRTITFVSPEILQISGTPAGFGVPVVFDRTVPKTSLIVNFNDGDQLQEENLDIAQKQAIMAVHEVLDGRFAELASDISMGGFKVRNLGAPVLGGDATNKTYVDTATGNLEPISTEITQVAAIRTQVQSVAAVDDEVVTVAGIAADVATVAGIAGALSDTAGALVMEEAVYTADGTQTQWALPATPASKDNVQISVNGLVQSSDDWTLVGLSTLEITPALPNGYKVRALVQYSINAAAVEGYRDQALASATAAAGSASSASTSASTASAAAATVSTVLARSGVPLGTIVHSALDLTLQGYLLLDGSPITPLHPDLRTAFLTAGAPWGMSGSDPLRPDEVTAARFRRAANGSIPLGTVQDDQMQSITGSVNVVTPQSGSNPTGMVTVSGTVEATVYGTGGLGAGRTLAFNSANSPGARTGTETRPKAIAYLPYIKAFGAISIEGMADLAALLTAIATQAEAELGTNNTQLMTPQRTKQHVDVALPAYNRWKTIFNAKMTGQAFIDINDFSSFESISINGSLRTLTNAASDFCWFYSTDGGATFVTSANYQVQFSYAVASTQSQSSGTASGGNFTNVGLPFGVTTMDISATLMRVPSSLQIVSRSNFGGGAFNSSIVGTVGAWILPTSLPGSAVNTIRLRQANSANFAGNIHIEGIRA